MRCPKCHYISFGSDRCRNCGYELALAPEPPPPVDLPITIDDAHVGPLNDLPLGDRTASGSSGSSDAPAAPARRSAALRSDLPLFSDRDAPLAAPTPLPPLSVRRPVPTITRPRPPSDESLRDAGPFEHEFKSEAELSRDSVVDSDAAPVFRRLLSGAIDATILGAINTGVVYLTLRVVGLQMSDARILPPVPLGAFLLLLNSGYLALFTVAGGQTIGKMIARLRVVAVSEGDVRPAARVPASAAVLRAFVWLVTLALAGVGFATILFDAERRALHDRAAGTRVVKA
jgi:uncharacterized RDD family membrane protein YckC